MPSSFAGCLHPHDERTPRKGTPPQFTRSDGNGFRRPSAAAASDSPAGTKPRRGDHDRDDLAKGRLLLRVAERAARVERLLRTRNGQLSVDRPRAAGRQHLAQLCPRPDGAEEARAGADHRDGPPAQAVGGKGP
jgi:hypothetical protein